MARARNIKPGFFTNDRLSEIHPLGRILFAGLWTIADKEGRLEDRPKKIKAEILPFDSCNADKLLTDLHKHGFILRYESNGTGYIQVVAWKKHQNPHIKEAESTIPAPGSNSSKPMQEPDNAQPKPERAGLIPDSLNLIPDSKATPRLVTENGQKPENPAPLEIEIPKITPQGAMAVELTRLGVAITSMNPDLLDWIARGVTIPQACEAVALARQKKPEPERISAGYLNTIIHGEIINPKQKKPSGPAWWSSDAATNAKAAELGLTANRGEEMSQFRDRIRSAMERKTQGVAA